jgi:hypothetical protein
MASSGLWTYKPKRSESNLWSEEDLTVAVGTVDTISEGTEDGETEGGTDSTVISRTKRVVRVDFSVPKGRHHGNEKPFNIGDAMAEIVTAMMMENNDLKFWAISGKYGMQGEYAINTERLFREFYYVDSTSTRKGNDKVSVFFKMESDKKVTITGLKKNNSVLQSLKNNRAYMFWHKIASPKVKTIGFLVGIPTYVINKEILETDLDEEIKQSIRYLTDGQKRNMGKLPAEEKDILFEINPRKFTHKTKSDDGIDKYLVATVMEVKCASDFSAGLAQLLCDADLNKQTYGQFIHSRMPVENNLLFRDIMLLQNQYLEKMEFIRVSGLSKKVMEGKARMLDEKDLDEDDLESVEQRIYDSMTTESADRDLETPMFTSVHMIDDKEGNWLVATTSKDMKEALDTLQYILTYAAQSEEFIKEKTEHPEKKIVAHNGRMSGNSSYLNYSRNLQEDVESIARSDTSWKEERLYNQHLNPNSISRNIEFGRSYAQATRTNTRTSNNNGGSSVDSTVSQTSNVSELDNATNTSPLSMSTVSTMINHAMMDMMREMREQRAMEIQEERRERDETRRAEAAEREAERKEREEERRLEILDREEARKERNAMRIAADKERDEMNRREAVREERIERTMGKMSEFMQDRMNALELSVSNNRKIMEMVPKTTYDETVRKRQNITGTPQKVKDDDMPMGLKDNDMSDSFIQSLEDTSIVFEEQFHEAEEETCETYKCPVDLGSPGRSG